MANYKLENVNGVWTVSEWYPNKKKIEELPHKDLISAWEYATEKYEKHWIDVEHQGRYGYLMTIEDWKESCDQGGFIDYDGDGDILDDDVFLEDLRWVSPSDRKRVTKGTHILWYNK